MSDIKVSIIMPVYNAAKYLRDTINSVRQQTFHDYELIAVDDGSTDESLEILNSIKDCRLRVIDKLNTGVSDTRNIGLQAASGDYVCFLDADDCLSPGYLQHMYCVVENHQADMVVCNYTPFRGTPNFTDENSEPYHMQSTKSLVQVGLLTSVWTKLIKRSTLYKQKITFDTRMTFGEDLFFCWKAFLASENVWMINEPLYGYRMTDGGAITKYHPELYEKYKVAFDDLKNFSEKEHHEMDVFFTTRMPSFIRMTIREKSSISQKKQRMRDILDDAIIQAVLKNWDSFQLEITSREVKFYKCCKDRKINLLLFYGYKEHIRIKLSFLKSKLRG